MFSFDKKISSFLTISVILFCCCGSEAQNLNNPNKEGPLGTQVNTLSGNLYMQRQDVYIPSRGIDIDMTFFYNSFLFDENYGFGKGWSNRYSISYRNDTLNGKTILWGDAREDVYTASGNNYIMPKGIFNTLTQYQSNKYLVKQPDGIKFYFDNSLLKKITRIEEPAGNFLNFTYTDTLLTAIANAAGQTISLSYNSKGNLSSITDAITTPTRTYTYQYDGLGNLTQVNDALGNNTKYTYLVNGPLKTLADKNSNTVDIIYYPDFTVSELIGCNKRQSFSYDTTLMLTTVTDYMPGGTDQITKYGYQQTDKFAWLTSLTSNCCGYNMNFEFDAQGNKTKQTDANGNITTYTYDDRGNVLTMKDALGQVMTYTYSTDYNKLLTYTDAKGFVTSLTYDAAGNLTQLTEPGNLVYTATFGAGGDILSSTDPKGNVFTYKYDAFGNPVSVTGPNNYHATMGFDARGNLISFTDPGGNTNNMEYDILDRLKKITDPVNNSVRLSYDAEGNPLTLVNQNNETRRFKYDASNRLVQFTDQVNNSSFLSYDAMDNVTQVKDALGNPKTFTYDARNRLASVQDALGNTNSLDYDANGNITAAHSPDGGTVTYTYDKLDRVVNVSDLNGPVAAITYDKNNNISGYTNGTGAATIAAYDSINRINKITDAVGNSSSLAYDKNGNIISFTDKNGFVKYYTYDSLDRVKTYTDNNGGIVTLAYDERSNMTSIKDQNNNTTAYTYDYLNRVKTMTYPDGRSLQYNYDNKGNILNKKLTDGSVISFVYDTLNRIISKALPDGQMFTYTYDAIDRVTSATNSAGTVSLAYDALNRLIAESFDGRTTRYNYDIAGRTQTIIYPDSTTITKTFDTRNRLISIAKNNNTIASYQYNNSDQVTAKTFANGVTTNLQYDFANRLSSLFTAAGAIQNSTYTYDNEMNTKTINRQNNAALSEAFSYDKGNRLTDYKRGPVGGSPLVTNTFAYDALGNRTAAVINGTNTTYTNNNLNQLTSSSNGIQNINFTYDNNGNRTYDGKFYKKYNAEGRLLTDSSSPSNIISYQYDAFNRRVKKTYSGTSSKYSYSGFSQIEERDGVTNSLKERTVFSNFISPVLNEINNNAFYYHQNELNSVEAITNSAGSLTESYRYDAYGNPVIYNAAGAIIPSSKAGNRFGFTGQEYDSATNSYHFYLRNYDPQTGTFNQRDPISYADGMGMYQYVHDNPANGIDILGLKDCVTREVSQAEKDFAANLSKLTNYLSMLNELLKTKDFDLAKKSSKYNKTAISLNIISLITKIDLLQKNYNGLSTKDVQVELAEIEFAVAGIANDLGAFNSVPGFNKALGIAGGIDAFTQEATGHSLSYHYAHLDDAQITRANRFLKKDQEAFDAREKYIDAAFKAQGHDVSKWTAEAREEYDKFLKVLKFRYENVVEKPVPNCPQNNNPGGTRRKPKYRYNPVTGAVEVVQSKDPNAIVGPDGLGASKYWVNAKDPLPYTILYENDLSASAPAKYVKVVYPIADKQDANTFYLGTFGFNNQNFTVPSNAPSYAQRLDCRDSLGLYVDVTAGLDVTTNTAFWEFQSIDPVTLLPPSDPLKGLLLLQDLSKPTQGHGFVNFSIKAKSTDVTLDTIHATAKIVFDRNDTIPTNYAKNTVDAFAPTSHLSTLSATSNNPVSLSWSGADDAGGCGLKNYTLYASTDGVNFNILNSGITRKDTTFTGAPGTLYYFFVLATDSVGNTESLRPGEVRSTFIGGTLPVTLLYFEGTNQGKDNLLEWATANEQNTRSFILERSLNNTDFSAITNVAAAGNSSVTNYYQYKDKNIDKLKSAVMYYRLQQTDISGGSKYSNIVRLNYLQERIKSLVYPNPTHDIITLVVGDNTLIGTQAYLVDVNGKLLETIKITGSNQQLQMNKYVSGTYFIRLGNKETIAVIKL